MAVRTVSIAESGKYPEKQGISGLTRVRIGRINKGAF
jgi:hypothetical protein